MNIDQSTSTTRSQHGKLRWSRGLLDALGRCAACGEVKASLRTYFLGDGAGLMPDRWSIHRCERCRSFYLDPRPDADSLPAAYLDYLTHNVGEVEPFFTSSAIGWALVRDYLSWRFGLRSNMKSMYGGRWLFRLVEPWRLKLDRFGRHLTRHEFPDPGRLLDVGCGNGDFLRLARAMGWQAEGCDPDPKVANLCCSRGFNVRTGGVETYSSEASAFDAVTLNQVIEHVLAPQELLAMCYRLLKPGGMLWLGFPNPEAMGARVFGAAWSGFHPPYHLCLPTRDVMYGWLKTVGFARIKFARRGAHAQANWRSSANVGRHEGIRVPSAPTRLITRVFADVVSTITPRWAEETVVIAWKPNS